MNKFETIKEAAINLFVENGFHGTATAKIAKEAGVANGTLFNYFKSKDELVIDLYLSVKMDLANFLGRKTVNSDNYKEAIKSQFSASLYWALDNRKKFAFIQQFNTSPYIGMLNNEIVQSQALPHLTLIQAGIDNGSIRNLPVELIYTLVSSQTFGVYHYLISKKFSKVQQHEIIEQTFEMLWDMIT